MDDPCRKLSLKRKRVEKQTYNVTFKEKKQRNDHSTGNDEHNDGAVEELLGIRPAPRPECSEAGVYFILVERASLCVANVGKKYQILNPDDHATFLRKQNKNPYDFRPDIVHEALLQIMSMAAHGWYGFCNMMVELLQKFRIKAKSNNATILRVIKNPVTKHLPINSHKIGEC